MVCTKALADYAQISTYFSILLLLSIIHLFSFHSTLNAPIFLLQLSYRKYTNTHTHTHTHTHSYYYYYYYWLLHGLPRIPCPHNAEYSLHQENKISVMQQSGTRQNIFSGHHLFSQTSRLYVGRALPTKALLQGTVLRP